MYVVLIEDRHSEPDAQLFSYEYTAVQFARQAAAHDGDAEVTEYPITEAMRQQGWLYYATWSDEGDCVRVMYRELDGQVR
jgi:hypothetical protein